jgi:NAD(P)-dependent dehydrogenase (short-subunit alcohol dehydrogenase family)
MEKILITGASSGIGRSLAFHLSKRFHVLALARRADRMRDEFWEEKNITPIEADLSEPQALSEKMDTILDQHGPIRYLINNAGVFPKATFLDASTELIQSAFQVNTWAPIFILKKLLPEMKRQNFGRVIHVTSGAPLNCFPGFGVYSASKAALNAFTVTAARENQDQNIKINLMSPGPTRTEMTPDAPNPPEKCHPTVDHLLSLPDDGETGRFFWLGHEVPLFPDLSGVDWMKGIPSPKMRKVF